ncbi:MAG: hypothetical protein R3C11_22620 [Planctomycetaceae bacterium]
MQTSTNDAGEPVHEMLVDYQNLENGGNGWLRVLEFVPAENKIKVKSYSQFLNEFKTEEGEQFELDYQMAAEPVAN